jgi:hypothetical protein
MCGGCSGQPAGHSGGGAPDFGVLFGQPRDRNLRGHRRDPERRRREKLLALTNVGRPAAGREVAAQQHPPALFYSPPHSGFESSDSSGPRAQPRAAFSGVGPKQRCQANGASGGFRHPVDVLPLFSPSLKK